MPVRPSLSSSAALVRLADPPRAPAAHSLNGSLIVNPWNTAETGEAIHQALTMPADEREDNHRKLYRYVSQYTAAHWVRPSPSSSSSSPVRWRRERDR